jgi:hypothetical protein
VPNEVARDVESGNAAEGSVGLKMLSNGLARESEVVPAAVPPVVLGLIVATDCSSASPVSVDPRLLVTGSEGKRPGLPLDRLVSPTLPSSSSSISSSSPSSSSSYNPVSSSSTSSPSSPSTSNPLSSSVDEGPAPLPLSGSYTLNRRRRCDPNSSGEEKDREVPTKDGADPSLPYRICCDRESGPRYQRRSTCPRLSPVPSCSSPLPHIPS